MNIKYWFKCKRMIARKWVSLLRKGCSRCCTTRTVYGVRDGLYLIENGFEPVEVGYIQDFCNGMRIVSDLFSFELTPELLRTIDERDRIRASTQDSAWANQLYLDVVANLFDLNPEQALDAVAPTCSSATYFAYSSMDTDQRKEFIATSPEIRKQMIDAVYHGGQAT